MSARSVLITLAAFGLAEPLEGQPRPTIWNLAIGAPAIELPEGFIELACGTNGGPPGRAIASFADFGSCQPDNRGWYEVYFRYDDEAEYVARAMEQSRAIEYHAGTRVYGIPVIVSALLDASGHLVGLRVATDPRGVEPGARNDHWTLAGSLMQHYGPEGWTCEAQPPAAGETAISSFFVKDQCTKSTADALLRVDREYFHRPGQYFVDEFGKVSPGSFTSATRFELTAAP